MTLTTKDPSSLQDNRVVATSSARGSSSSSSKVDVLATSLIALIVIVSIVTLPDKATNGTVTLKHVWYYGWITAISTGLGALPFYFVKEPNKFWIGVSNAIAGGMMIAASYSLAYEGCTYDTDAFNYNYNDPSLINDPSRHNNNNNNMQYKNPNRKYNLFGYTDDYDISDPYSQLHSPLVLMISGFLLGVVFIISTKQILDEYDDLKMSIFSSRDDSDNSNGSGVVVARGSSAQKMVLIVFVMTLHSITEGIGIGVSFGGKTGMQLGQFISMSLAVHNIPEGLAVALVLTSRKVSKVRAALWAVFTSLPQPLMALPAYIFVERFIPLLPTGLGFASGAMAYVATFELLQESIEDTSVGVAAAVGSAAFVCMMIMQEAVKIAL